MNNAFVKQNIEIKEIRNEKLLLRQAELLKIIDAIGIVGESESWKVLKSHIFEGAVEAIEKSLKSEVEKTEVNVHNVYRLQGQLAWARKYADFDKLKEFFKVELSGVKNLIKNG